MKKLLLTCFSLLLLPSIAFGQLGNVTLKHFNGVPSGSCSRNQQALNDTSGALYACNPAIGTWVSAGGGGGSGTVNPNNGTAGALTNYPAAGGSTTVGPDSALTTNGAGNLTDTTGGTDLTLTQGTITTSNPFLSHTATWNAGGVAFTNELSNLTCIAAATNSLVSGWGVGASDWQLKYSAANCGSPQLLLPQGTGTKPSVAASSSTGTGLYFNSNNSVELASASVGYFAVESGQTAIRTGTNLGWANGDPASVTIRTSLGEVAAGLVGIGQSQTTTDTSGKIKASDTVFVTSNFTTAASTSLQAITGLSWTFPAVALNWSFHCHIAYSQATGNAAVAFGIQAVTNAPTNIFATGELFTAAGTVTTGVLPTLTTTTATNIVSGTPGATATNFVADLHGTAELGASANTLNIMVSTATSADAVTVLRGSYCALTP